MLPLVLASGSLVAGDVCSQGGSAIRQLLPRPQAGQEEAFLI